MAENVPDTGVRDRGTVEAMDFAFTEADEAFRAELSAWLDENLPAFEASREADASAAEGQAKQYERRQAWQRRLAADGWAAINWKKEWGGREATIMQNVIYSEEMAKARAPGVYNANGIWQVGPMIERWGTDEQRSRWLPDILNADHHWCQGFSEPEAGSDLANLKVTAIRDGEEYVVNGEKIWCTTAHLAKWGLFLLRTDPTAIERGVKHEGITAFIIDLETPGIVATPITDIVAEDSFCSVVFTDARIPLTARLGDEGAGWLVAMGTLGHERVGTSGLSITMKSDLDRVVETARRINPAALADPELRDRIGRVYTQIAMTRLLNYRALSKVLKGGKNWPEVPIAKLQWSHLAQAIAELNVDLLGLQGMLTRGGPDTVDKGQWTRLYSFQRMTSIGAGTTQVQKNIIADKAIKLPRR
jgi:alkylation response protein AidB-like acyl-CoA dehydrogenase